MARNLHTAPNDGFPPGLPVISVILQVIVWSLMLGVYVCMCEHPLLFYPILKELQWDRVNGFIMFFWFLNIYSSFVSIILSPSKAVRPYWEY